MPKRSVQIDETKIRELLKRSGLSQERLADKAGLDVKTASRACNGKEVDRDTSWRIARALGTRVSEIILLNKTPETLIEEYRSDLRDLLEPIAKKYVDVPYESETEVENIDTIATATRTENLHFIGMSGSGKSFLCSVLTYNLFGDSTLCPVYVDLKRFDTNFKDCVDDSIAPVFSGGAENLIEQIRKTGRVPVVILDGLNECPENKLRELLLDAVALLRSGDFRVVTTGQHLVELPPNFKGKVVRFSTLNVELKQRIFEKHSSQKVNDEALCFVRTPFEISVASKVPKSIWMSRGEFLVLNSYCETLLSEEESPRTIFEILVLVAQQMSDAYRVSLDHRGFIELSTKITRDLGKDVETARDALNCRLVNAKSERVVFTHEKIGDYFLAESLMRRGMSPEQFAVVLQTPIYRRLTPLIFETYSDVEDLRRFWEACDWRQIQDIESSFRTEIVREFISREAASFLARTEEELITFSREGTLNFESNKMFVDVQLPQGRRWSSADQGMMGIIVDRIGDIALFERLLDLIQLSERVFFQTVAKRLPKFTWGNANSLFWCLYVVSGNNRPMITAIYAAITSGFGSKFKLGDDHLKSLAKRMHSSAILYLLLRCRYQFMREGDFHQEEFGLAFQSAVKSRFAHLRMEGFEVAADLGRNGKAGAIVREALSSMPSPEDPLVGTSFVEALKATGLLDPPGEGIVPEPKAILANRDSEESQQQAHDLIVGCFDGPYDDEYAERMNMLSPEEQATIYEMAANAHDVSLFFGTIILSHLLRDTGTIGELGLKGLKRFGGMVPNESDFFQQDSTSMFVISNIGLGQLNQEPDPIDRPLSSRESIWIAFGALIRLSSKETWSDKDSVTHWKTIHLHSRAAAQVLFAIFGARHDESADSIERLVTNFPHEVLTLCASGIDGIEDVPEFRRKEALVFYASMISRYGGVEFVPHLKRLANSSVVGDIALRGLARLDSLR